VRLEEEAKAEIVTRQGQVSEQLENLERAIGHLGEVVDCVEGRLKPVLREKDEDENKPDAQQLVSLADKINTLTIHVGQQTKRLADILERLEL